MHNISPIARLTDDLLVGIAIKEIMLLAHKLEYREMEYTGAIITIRDVRLLLVMRPVAT